jgi:hypothetical protein
MENKKIQYSDFYEYFVSTVKIKNHLFFTPRQVGMSTCGINYILKYCNDNKVNGVYFYPNEKHTDNFSGKRFIDWCGWVIYKKNILRKNGNTIYITSKYDEIVRSYNSLKIKIFIFDDFSYKQNFIDIIPFLDDENVKCIFLETNDEKKYNDVKQIYKNILNDKRMVLHYLTINDFLNIKKLSRKSKIEEIFGDNLI